MGVTHLQPVGGAGEAEKLTKADGHVGHGGVRRGGEGGVEGEGEEREERSQYDNDTAVPTCRPHCFYRQLWVRALPEPVEANYTPPLRIF